MKFTKVVLDNGLTVLHEKRDVPVTTFMLAVRYGSAYETKEEKGIAHFIEHLCFKGTDKRDMHQISREIEEIGGDLNAFTHEEVTAYYAKIPSQHLRIAADVLSDVFFNAEFPEEEIPKEANVVCEETKMYKDNPRSHVFNTLKEYLFEAPFGMNIGGTESNVRGMSKEILLKKHRGIYAPSNAILCVVGNNSFEEVVNLAKEFCVEREPVLPEAPKIISRKKIGSEKRPGVSQTNLAMGVHFPFSKGKERYAAQIFSTILGGGMSSKLFSEVREKRGLVYGVRTDIDSGKNYGYLVIYAGTTPTKTEEVFKICEEEFKKMGELSLEELETAKVRLLGGRDVDSESSNGVAVDLVMEEIWGEAEEYYEFENHVNDVSLEDVQKLSENLEFSKFYLGP